MKTECAFIAAMLLLVYGCRPAAEQSWLPQSAPLTADRIDIEGAATPVYMGGYGSSISFNAQDSSFYILTDRGPNVDGTTDESKIFPVPGYTPSIGKFKLIGDSLVRVERITLKDSNGTPFNGLPNTEGDGVTGETAYNLAGEVITHSVTGIDTEGMAMAPDGTFWVSDEYGPFVMQFDRTGKLLRQMSPSQGLPHYYAKRRPNRGMEGLTISTDGKRLFGIMQSPLYMPDESTRNVSVNNRILMIDLATGGFKEYLYQLDSPRNVVSEITFVNDSTFLVMERDGKFPEAGKGFKRVFRIGLGGATDIHNRIVEPLTAAQLQEQGIVPTGKELFVDILTAIPSYRHDKPEGIALIGDSILCVVNDDDFGVTSTGDGKFTAKTDKQGVPDRSTVYFIRLR